MLKVLSKFALIPGGGSYTNIRDARRRLTGAFGFISMVMNKRKLGCGCRVCSFFSNEISHCVAKCTFFNKTHLEKQKIYYKMTRFYAASIAGTTVPPVNLKIHTVYFQLNLSSFQLNFERFSKRRHHENTLLLPFKVSPRYR